MPEKPILFKGPMIRAIMEGRKSQTRRIVTRLKGFGPITEFQPSEIKGYDWCFRNKRALWNYLSHEEILGALPYQVGDTLWCRETHKLWFPTREGQPIDGFHVRYQADGQESIFEDVGWDEGPEYLTPHDCGLDIEPSKWRPSIYMPRWAARLFFQVTDVRLEWLQDISEEDAEDEGAPYCEECGGRWGRGAVDDPLNNAMGGKPWSMCFGPCDGLTAVEWFHELWNSINGKKPGASWDDNPVVAAYTFRKLEGYK